MKLKFAWLALLALMTLLVAAPLPASAQNDPRDRMVQSLELDQADIRDALKLLFRMVGANYSVASDVQGTVTISLQNVPFETALRAVLNQVDATWRVEGGIYNIIKKPEVATTVPGLDPTLGAGTAPQQNSVPRRIKIRSADPYPHAGTLQHLCHSGPRMRWGRRRRWGQRLDNNTSSRRAIKHHRRRTLR